MKRIFKYLCCLIFLVACFVGKAQDKSTASNKKYKFTLYAGFGPNFYFNNLTIGKEYVRELNYQFVTRFMWEPEHFLSLGFETGYNRLYSMKENPTANSQVKINNALIPIQLVISMKFFKDFYGNFSMGQSVLLNNVNTNNNGTNNKINATGFSLGDFGIAAGYRKSFHTKYYLGAELKGYYSSKLNDKNIGLAIMGGYRF